MKPIFLFIQCDNSTGWDNAPHEIVETSDPQTARDTIKAIATLTNKQIRVSYPSSINDKPTNLNGHYFDPKQKI